MSSPIINYIYINMPPKVEWNCAFHSEVGRVELNKRGRVHWVSAMYRIIINQDGLELKYLRGDLRLDLEEKLILRRVKQIFSREVRYKIYQAAKTL